MPRLYAAALVLLAAATTAAAGLLPRQSTCSSPAKNFQLAANTSATEVMYGALGGPCYNVTCGVFFSVDKTTDTSFFSIKSNGDLVVASTDQPSDPDGFVAYNNNLFKSVVYFGKPSIVKQDGYNKISCALEADPSGDGSCNLKCAKSGGKTGDSVNPKNDNQWNIGKPGFTQVVIKAIFS